MLKYSLFDECIAITLGVKYCPEFVFKCQEYYKLLKLYEFVSCNEVVVIWTAPNLEENKVLESFNLSVSFIWS